MADIIPFPGERAAEDRESARLTILLEGRALSLRERAELGSLEEWAWTAASYLKVIQHDIAGSGRMLVSVPAIAIVLAYIEELAGRLGIIPPPCDPEAA